MNLGSSFWGVGFGAMFSFFFQGLAPPWFGSPGPLVPWSSGPLVPWFLVLWSPGPGPLVLSSPGFSASVASWLLGFGGFLASWLQWLQWLRGSWFLGFGGFLASRLQWLLASRLRLLLGFSGLKQLHFQDGYMSLSPNSTCHFC